MSDGASGLMARALLALAAAGCGAKEPEKPKERAPAVAPAAPAAAKESCGEKDDPKVVEERRLRLAREKVERERGEREAEAQRRVDRERRAAAESASAACEGALARLLERDGGGRASADGLDAAILAAWQEAPRACLAFTRGSADECGESAECRWLIEALLDARAGRAQAAFPDAALPVCVVGADPAACQAAAAAAHRRRPADCPTHSVLGPICRAIAARDPAGCRGLTAGQALFCRLEIAREGPAGRAALARLAATVAPADPALAAGATGDPRPCRELLLRVGRGACQRRMGALLPLDAAAAAK